jgi:hypothetical protein
MGKHEFDDFTVAVCRLFSLPTRLIHHAEAIVSVMHVGITFQELACGNPLEFQSGHLFWKREFTLTADSAGRDQCGCHDAVGIGFLELPGRFDQ